jgi:DoxX-like family
LLEKATISLKLWLFRYFYKTLNSKFMKSNLNKIVNISIALVWIANGLFCKVLHLVPRHEMIVARILGTDYARPLTIAIGCSEIAMAIWILTRIKMRLNAIAQIIIVATMNTIEFLLAPDLLLWGKLNSIFAFLFILLVFYNAFYLNKKKITEN